MIRLAPPTTAARPAIIAGGLLLCSLVSLRSAPFAQVSASSRVALEDAAFCDTKEAVGALFCRQDLPAARAAAVREYERARASCARGSGRGIPARNW